MTAALPVPRVTQGVPGAESLDAVGVQRNLQALAELFPTVAASAPAGVTVFSIPGTTVTVAFGTGTFTWPGGQKGSTVLAVTHGLGKTPTAVFAIGNQDQGANDVFACTGSAIGATTFSMRAVFTVLVPAAAFTATFSWLAIG